MRNLSSALLVIFLLFGLITTGSAETNKTRLFIVSSYHREYLWSQDTNKGVCAALLDFKFLDSQKEADEYTSNDFIEGARTVVKKAWMDTKRKNTKSEIANTVARIMQEIKEFKPDLILLGDDNASNFIGNQFIDSDIPVIFWGIDGLPLKYGLIDSLQHPGHNVTGIYQSGYLKECIEYLKKLVPSLKTFAILSDDSETGRANAKELEKLQHDKELPLYLVKTVITNSFSEWKAQALILQDKADAIFVANHNTLKDDQGRSVDQLEAGAWYLRHIKKPDCGHEKQFVQEGMLLVADDSGYKQGYEAVSMAHQILHEKKNPADIPVIAPTRGAIIVNRERAAMLGIDLTGKDFVELYIDKASALEKYPEG